MVLPNVIIIGAQKAGTTSLHYWLGQHPEVYGPAGAKDFHFFCDEEYYNRGLNFYSSFFSGHKDEKIVLAGAVNYIYLPNTPQRLIEYNPNLKLILCIRNPVDRLYSAYKFNNLKGIEPLKLEEALEEEDQRINLSWKNKHDYSYADHGYYNVQLKRYLEFFRPNQIHVVKFEYLKDKPEKVFSELCNFLNIDNTFTPSFKVLNEGGEVMFGIINKFISKDNFLKKWLRNNTLVNKIMPLDRRIVLKQKIRFVNTKKGKSKYGDINPELRRQLNSEYKESIMELERLTGLELNDWLTE